MILDSLKLWKEQKSIDINKKGIFLTYNIVGAAFLIKTEIFRKLGWFNEYYFFCPEDIELSTRVNLLGYKCYVDANVELYHLEGGTASLIKAATMPAGMKGSISFYSHNNIFIKYIIYIFIFIIKTFKIIYWFFKSKSLKRTIFIQANKNCIESLFLKLTPKEIFIKYYSRLKKI